MVKLKVQAGTVALDTELPADMDVGTVSMLLGQSAIMGNIALGNSTWRQQCAV